MYVSVRSNDNARAKYLFLLLPSVGGSVAFAASADLASPEDFLLAVAKLSISRRDGYTNTPEATSGLIARA